MVTCFTGFFYDLVLVGSLVTFLSGSPRSFGHPDQSGHPGGSGHNLHNLHFAKFSILSSASLDGFSVLLFCSRIL